MPKNSQTSSTSSSVDPGTKAYIEQYRQRAAAQPGYQTGMQGIENYSNPYQQQVIGQIQEEGNRQAGFANLQAADMATRAGAYGGSREAVLRAQMMGDVQRQTGQNVAQYSASGYEDAANRMMQERQFGANLGLGQLNAMQGGFTPTSQSGTETMTQSSSLFPQLLGAGLGIGGMLLGGPAGAAVGSSIGRSLMNPQGRVSQGGGLNFGSRGGNVGFGGGYRPSANSWQFDPYMGQGDW